MKKLILFLISLTLVSCSQMEKVLIMNCGNGPIKVLSPNVADSGTDYFTLDSKEHFTPKKCSLDETEETHLLTW